MFDSRFVEPVAQEVVSVKSYDGQWEVSTFRTIGKNCLICCLLLILIFVVELPHDFAALQEEIERQKLALLDKNKRKETMEVSGNNPCPVKSSQFDVLK